MSSVALSKDPTVNSWMFNLIGAVPLAENRFQPYVSGGIGGVTLRSQTFDQSAVPIVTVQGTLATNHNTINTAQSHFGSNIGGGFFAYANQWGIRADVRYYDVTRFSTNTLTNGSVPSDFTQALLSGLNYWRANLGVSFRW
jgi:outer membrane protein W